MVKRARKGSARNAHSSGGNVGHIYDSVLSLTNSVLGSQKSRGADQIRSLSRAAKSAAGEISDLPDVQRSAQSVSKGLQDLSDYIAKNDIQDILSNAKRLAEKYPVAMTIGFLALGYNLISRVPVPDFGFGKAKSRSKGKGRSSTRKSSAKKSSASK